MKRLKKLVAIALGATMILSTVAVSANPAPTHLQGTGAVINPVFAVLLPTAPIIRVNPLQIGSIPAVEADPLANPPVLAAPAVIQPQISSVWQVIANRSNVPVAVQMRIAPSTVATPNNATFHDTMQAFNTAVETEATATSRAAFLQVVFAEDVPTLPSPAPSPLPILNTSAAAALQGLAWEAYEDTPAVQILYTPPGTEAGAAMTGGHVVHFLLAEHEYNFNAATGVSTIVAGPMDDDQYTAFTFDGAVNPAATWAANQVAVRIVFTITGIAPVNFEAIESAQGTDEIANSHRAFSAVDLTARPTP